MSSSLILLICSLALSRTTSTSFRSLYSQSCAPPSIPVAAVPISVARAVRTRMRAPKSWRRYSIFRSLSVAVSGLFSGVWASGASQGALASRSVLRTRHALRTIGKHSAGVSLTSSSAMLTASSRRAAKIRNGETVVPLLNDKLNDVLGVFHERGDGLAAFGSVLRCIALVNALPHRAGCFPLTKQLSYLIGGAHCAPPFAARFCSLSAS